MIILTGRFKEWATHLPINFLSQKQGSYSQSYGFKTESSLADELTGALDTKTSCDVMDLIQKSMKGKTILVVTRVRDSKNV